VKINPHFPTPKTEAQLFDWAMSLTRKDRQIALRAIGLTWNYLVSKGVFDGKARHNRKTRRLREELGSNRGTKTGTGPKRSA
jgi:hypothetical protein